MNNRSLLRWLVVAAFLVAMWLGARAGYYLVLDSPRPSDVILVLAGETNERPKLALQMLAQGYGRQVVLDVPTNSTIYEFTQIQLAQKYVQDLPQGGRITICPIDGLSTKAESDDVERCLKHEQARSVLIVTSDYHTRRALSVFRKMLPQHEYSTAGAHDDQQFGPRWWTHRQWAKTFVDEWLRLFWWKVVDQWR